MPPAWEGTSGVQVCPGDRVTRVGRMDLFVPLRRDCAGRQPHAQRAMTMATDDTLEHVSDTALWVAYYRGEESERADALFRDPHARRLAGERGQRIAAAMGPTARYTRWTLVIRTVIIDRFIAAEIAAEIGR